jgi:hypothetical protein
MPNATTARRTLKYSAYLTHLYSQIYKKGLKTTNRTTSYGVQLRRLALASTLVRLLENGSPGRSMSLSRLLQRISVIFFLVFRRGI